MHGKPNEAGRPCSTAWNFGPRPAMRRTPRTSSGVWRRSIEQLSRHTALEVELRTLRANMRAAEKTKDDLVAAARARITEADAKVLILSRFRRVLNEQFDEYLKDYQRGLVAAVENLWAKYAVTARQILAERDREAAQLDGFLKELGYE